jgi:subtilisin
MKNHKYRSVSWLVILSWLLWANRMYALNAGDPVPGQFMVKLKPKPALADPAVTNRIFDLLNRHSLEPQSTFEGTHEGFTAAISPDSLLALKADPEVDYVVPDRVVMTQAGFSGMASSGDGLLEIVPAGVQRIGAFNLIVDGGGVGVAVVDTGLDFNQEDLIPLGTPSFSAIPNKNAQDDNGHGTHVGGIIAARWNGIGVVGVAPRATLYAVKVLDQKGAGTDSRIYAGLNWVLQNANVVNPKIRVVNMSLGRPGTIEDNPLLRSVVVALYNVGITVVVAAGNDASKEISQQVPAAYPEVISVASTTALTGASSSPLFPYPVLQDTASFFTTDGAPVDISAPGEDMENIDPDYLRSVGILSTKLGGGTTRLFGSSMAAAHVTGVIALMWQQQVNLTPEQVRGKIQASALHPGVAPLDNFEWTTYTFDGAREGIVNAPGALQ